jgi:ADP-heptose:LPS heptosyltransferase
MRPLVLRCGGFGEIVLLTALLEQLHVRFGEPVDVISSGPWTLPLLQGLPAVGEVFVMRSRKAPYWMNLRQQRLVHWLRARGAGPTWFADATGTARDLLKRGGIPDDYVCDTRTMPSVEGEHFVERWIRFAEQTPPAFEGRLPQSSCHVPRAARLQVSPQSLAALEDWLAQHGIGDKPFVAIQAGNKRSGRDWFRPRSRSTNTKYWPETCWAQVIRAVRDMSPDHAILLLGVRNEYSLNADIARLAAVPGIYNVAGDMPVTRLLPLLQRASGMISVDTGPAHAAAALGCPTVALFGKADPTLYRPGGVTTPAATLTGEVEGELSMLGITPEAVIAAWTRLRAAAHLKEAMPRSSQAATAARPDAADRGYTGSEPGSAA